MSIEALTGLIASGVQYVIWLGGVGLLALGMALAVRTVWSGYRMGAQRIDGRHRNQTEDQRAWDPEVSRPSPGPEPMPPRGPLGPKRGGRDVGDLGALVLLLGVGVPLLTVGTCWALGHLLGSGRDRPE